MSEELKKQIMDLVTNPREKLFDSGILPGPRGIEAEPAVIKKLITELVNEGKLEYSSNGGATFSEDSLGKNEPVVVLGSLWLRCAGGRGKRPSPSAWPRPGRSAAEKWSLSRRGRITSMPPGFPSQPGNPATTWIPF